MNSDITVENTEKTGFFSLFLHLVKKNAVMFIAALAAIITSFIIPPDAEYASYFNLKTLSCLFATLAVICALKNIRFFTVLAEKIVSLTGNLRSATIALVYITFIGSMIIANDMALITFLPLGYYVLFCTKNEKYMASLFVLQNISANLGGMLTPFGNPQNLFLYSYFNIPTTEFMGIMLLPFLLSVTMLTGCCFFLPKTPISYENHRKKNLPKRKTVYYLLLFAVSILIVFGTVPYYIGLPIVVVGVLLFDRDALLQVDYALLMTFVFFFIFAGNMARIDAVNNLLSFLLDKNTLLFSVISCQFISNVPSAVLLSHFTADYRSLLMGVNVGGTGTLIASLASLITFKNYVFYNKSKAGRFIKVFSAYNFSFLIILTAFCLLLNAFVFN